MSKSQQINGLDVPTVDSSKIAVTFTRRQWQYLEKVFGEAVGSASLSADTLRFNSGVRTVVHHVKGLIHD